MADFVFKISPNIILGSYSASRIGQFVQEWGTKFMVLLDPILHESGISAKIKQSLTDRNVDFFIFDEIPNAPDSKVVSQALKLAKEAHIHGIIAVGGPKTCSIGRVVASLYYEVLDLYTFLDGSTPTAGTLPLICVPTTMRDIFLFSDSTPLIDARSRQLKILKLQNNITKLSIFDPNLSVSLTDNQVSSVSLETLCMAVESYISQKSNFFSDTIAEKAMELIISSLDGAPTLSSATSPELFFAQGGCMTSISASATFPGAATLLALTINARFKVSHSVVASILFPYIIEDAAKYKTEKLAKVARILRVATESSSDDVAVSALAENIRKRLAMANLPTRLKDLSVSIEQLAIAAEDAGALDLINYMPRSMTADDLFDLIKQAY
ncbi:MAG: iron-containing alcohol dehydrogenase [Treponemataceae bacterium]|nr:iron-containing alcohol dehydrogenase [Treponemataceae bacterium]